MYSVNFLYLRKINKHNVRDVVMTNEEREKNIEETGSSGVLTNK